MKLEHIGDVVKLENGKWLVQFPKGVTQFDTKRNAMKWAELLKKEDAAGKFN